MGRKRWDPQSREWVEIERRSSKHRHGGYVQWDEVKSWSSGQDNSDQAKKYLEAQEFWAPADNYSDPYDKRVDSLRWVFGSEMFTAYETPFSVSCP